MIFAFDSFSLYFFLRLLPYQDTPHRPVRHPGSSPRPQYRPRPCPSSHTEPEFLNLQGSAGIDSASRTITIFLLCP
jgi:hypothetical protein